MGKASSSGLSSALAGGSDTIVARATPAGRGALAVVRVSGPGVEQVVERLCPGLKLERGWAAQLVSVLADDGELLDRAVAIPYRSPRSYTGEDMVELVLHGSPALVCAVIEASLAAGARQAEPGEFTRRALANGKMDLLQAEGVAELVAAETAGQLRNARRQVEGELSRYILELRSSVVDLLAAVEGSLDFAEEPGLADLEQLERLRQRCREQLLVLLASAAAGTRIREGVRVVILGEVNAGKSTLFNSLAGAERAIVSERPGTTRDLLEAEVELGGVRAVLVDTAGIRATADPVELEGVRRARAAAAGAEVAVVLWPVGSPVPPPVPETVPTVRVRSKADLGREAAAGGWLPVSVLTGAGLEELRGRLAALVGFETDESGQTVAISRRHRLALERALAAVAGAPLAEAELAAEDLRLAVRALGEVVGEVGNEEVLTQMFATFCIGK